MEGQRVCARALCEREREIEKRENGVVGIFVLVLTCCSCNPSGIPRARSQKRRENRRRQRRRLASHHHCGRKNSRRKFKLTRTVFPIPSAARASDPASCEGRDASLAMAMANRRGGRLSPRTRSGRTPKRLHSGVTRAGGSWASPSALRASTCAAARPRDGRTSRSLPSSSSPPSRSPEPMTCLLCTSRFVARCQAVVRTAGLARTFANFRPGKI